VQCRKGFEQTLIVLDQLIGVFEAAGPERSVDIDNAAQRESLDVIGRVGAASTHSTSPHHRPPDAADVHNLYANPVNCQPKAFSVQGLTLNFRQSPQ
jgi:hypothetical protein